MTPLKATGIVVIASGLAWLAWSGEIKDPSLFWVFGIFTGAWAMAALLKVSTCPFAFNFGLKTVLGDDLVRIRCDKWRGHSGRCTFTPALFWKAVKKQAKVDQVKGDRILVPIAFFRGLKNRPSWAVAREGIEYLTLVRGEEERGQRQRSIPSQHEELAPLLTPHEHSGKLEEVGNYLKDLLQDTPSGRMKLLAVWDTLCPETQIKLLHALTADRPNHLHREIVLKALDSPHVYIRYLAGRANSFNSTREEDRNILERLASDVSPLVKYAQEERVWHILMEAELFAGLPKEQKLAIVRSGVPPRAQKIARWIDWAIENRHASDEELLDIVAEYVRNPDALRLTPLSKYEGYSWYLQSQDFEAIWRVVPKVSPETALELVIHLPAEIQDGHTVPEDVLGWLHGPYLRHFLYRQDVRLTAFRKKVFFSTEGSYTNEDKAAAAYCHFDLAVEEFHRLLRQRSDLLKELTHSRSLRLVFFQALEDYFAHEESDSSYAASAEMSFEQRAKELDGKRKTFELREVKIYRLAKLVRPWDARKPNFHIWSDDLKFLNKKVVSGDTWATFVAFHEALESGDLDYRLSDYVGDTSGGGVGRFLAELLAPILRADVNRD